MSLSRRRAMAIVAVGALFVGVVAVLPLTRLDSARLERATTKTTRTSQIMTDDETLVRKLAERYLEAVNNDNNATVAELNCAKAAPGLLQIATKGEPVTMTGQLERAPVQERYYAYLTIGGRPGPRMVIVKQDGVWCVRD